MKQVTHHSPVQFFVGSCPDYSHDNGKYTHKYLGSGIPLLTQFHLQSSEGIFEILDSFNVPYVYTIMVADVEAMDEVFCSKFTSGNQAAFLERCKNSVLETQQVLEVFQHKYKGTFRSSSFFIEFGFERFISVQEAYQSVLSKRCQDDTSFSSRVVDDILARRLLYGTMYGDVMTSMLPDEKIAFLTDRTIRTMAQYLTLGRLIGECKNAVIINHPTRNINVFNDRNKFLLVEDDPRRPQPTIPILRMIKEVY